MLNWIVWNKTSFDNETVFFEIEQFWNLIACKQKIYTYTWLNCLKENCFWLLNCVLRKTELFERELFFDIETVYLSKTELFKVELFFDIEIVYLC